MYESDSSSQTFSEDTTQALIGSMESQIDMLQDEVEELKKQIHKINKKIQTYQSIIKSDLIGKIFKCL